MKIALAQINVHIGNFEANFNKIANFIEDAKKQQADIILFPELSVCGYPPRDFLDFDDFVDKCYEVIEKIKPLTQEIAVVVGSPSRNPKIEGKDLYNSAFFIFEGEIKHIVNKALLPTYDIFDEYRYFEPATEFQNITFKGRKIALTVCEDLWNVGNDNPMYKACPMDVLIKDKVQPEVMLNISASPFDYDHAAGRITTLKANTTKYKIPVFYVNHCGAQTDLIFDGGSIVVNANSVVFDEMKYFEEQLSVYDLDEVIASKQTQTIDNVQPKVKIDLIYRALVTGIRNYFEKLGFKKAILGLSGGVDSALTAVLAADALGAENVWGLLMPSQYSTGHSVTDALELANNLGIKHDTIAIKNMYDSVVGELTPLFNGKSFDVTEENIQARLRGLTLMAMCNKHGYILLNTTNKSEAAVGYGTLYGDLCGGLAVLADVYKTEVYELVAYINREKEIIPQHIITKAPSAELRPGQKDQDTLPPYDVLDKILFQYIELSQSPQDILNLGFDEHTVRRTLKMVNSNEWKRFQFPPVLRVSPKAFGVGRRMPIEGKYLS
ncbi:MAG TPA: NAD+ synthase [Chitinophagales bacterium]|nr:NAD+ synthase [Chitinophagales bacterium]